MYVLVRHRLTPLTILQVFPPQLEHFYPLASAVRWVSLEKLQRFIAREAQQLTPEKPAALFRIDEPSNRDCSPEYIPSSSPPSSPLVATQKQQRMRMESESDDEFWECEKSAGEENEEVEPVDGEEELVSVTRQLRVRRVETLRTLPTTWSVPQRSESMAYLLDLDGTRLPKDKEGLPHSMITLIKDMVCFSFFRNTVIDS